MRTHNRLPALTALGIALALFATQHEASTVGPGVASFRLASRETALAFEAGPAAPGVSQISFNGGEVWRNRIPEALIQSAEVAVGVRNETRALRWQYNPGASKSSAREVQLVYDCRSPHLRSIWEWEARGRSGPLEHSIEIQNLGPDELWLPLQDSFQFDFAVAAGQGLEQVWIEKGAGAPSAVGVHHVPFSEGFRWTGTSSTYAHPGQGEQREMIPYLLVQRNDGERSGWYVGIEFSGRTRIKIQRDGDSLSGAAGLNPEPGPFRTRLAAGGSFRTPTIFIGAFEGGPDGAGKILRRWVRQVLNNPLTIQNASYPMLVSNSWGSGMAINETQAQSMIRDAAALGLEMFHLDAGWFRGVGDWVSNPAKFPHGVASVADYAHGMGLKFGLWTDWTQAGIGAGDRALNVNDSEVRAWLTMDPPAGWQPEEFKGVTIDIGVPAARERVTRILSGLVGDLHLDMLEHDGYLVAQGCDRTDHPHAPPEPARTKHYKDEGFLWSDGPNSTDVSYHATRAYYDVYSELRRENPNLLFEICNDGGRMVDFGSAAHGDYFSITDSYNPTANRQAFFDASFVLPPAMLETYVEKWPTPRIENFRYMLRSGMMGWFSLMLDSTTWTAEQHAAAREEFSLYKSRLRPLIRNADLYHVSARPDGVHWDGIEYFDPAARRGVLFAFRGSTTEETSHEFVLQGFDPKRRYRLAYCDHSSPDQKASGRQLAGSGVRVVLPAPNSSEVVFIEEAAR